MRDIEQLTQSEVSSVRGVLFDLDGTILDDGRLPEEAYRALFALSGAGLRLIALTGRPASWAEVLARMWPIEAAIAENGPIAFRREDSRLAVWDTASSKERADRKARLAGLVKEARRTLPSLVPSDDVQGRISDFTFDIGEYHRAEPEVIEQARRFVETAGGRTTCSSVHLHFTFDRHDKATGALHYLSRTGVDATRARQQFVFIGDSENDAPCFNAFGLTIAVSNLSGRFSLGPRYRTRGASSRGFCEAADALLCRM